jgi:hypothetical protein
MCEVGTSKCRQCENLAASRVAHGAYANAGGTNAQVVALLIDRRAGGGIATIISPPKTRVEMGLTAARNSARQGIARARRHVAPARLLC